jgi:hypothetical protein
MTSLDHDARGYEDGLSGKWNPYTLEHHPQEDDQVTVLAYQGENIVYGLQGLMILLTYQTVQAKGSRLPLSIHRIAEKRYSRKLGFRCKVFSETQ